MALNLRDWNECIFVELFWAVEDRVKISLMEKKMFICVFYLRLITIGSLVNTYW